MTKESAFDPWLSNPSKLMSDWCKELRNGTAVPSTQLQYLLVFLSHKITGQHVSTQNLVVFMPYLSLKESNISADPSGHAVLRRESAAAYLLGLRVRIPPGARMSVCSDCCVLSGWSFIQRSPTDCDVSECDRVASIMGSPWPLQGCEAINKCCLLYICSPTRYMKFF